MAGKEGFDYKVANFVEKKSEVIGVGALGFAYVASFVAPPLVGVALGIAAWEGGQYVVAKLYKNK